MGDCICGELVARSCATCTIITCHNGRTLFLGSLPSGWRFPGPGVLYSRAFIQHCVCQNVVKLSWRFQCVAASG